MDRECENDVRFRVRLDLLLGGRKKGLKITMLNHLNERTCIFMALNE